ncbi:hypothetical protein [Chryseobacterium camelliae]|uniref:hypothetical protein n=1 Tax=Chryseobacterium camelliae TaxID=1265445 RepID=UPI002859C437|nr:hypothetical protein [Chryseobacterium camelliae]MDR6516767.1 hypothetical protein [Chryseobacterium camelliae]
MKEIGKSIFNLQRFQILQTKLNPETTSLIPNDYAYAWYKKLYPLFEENELHEDLQQYFSITKEQVDEITAYADKEWLEKKYYTFYEYEQHYNCRINPVMGITRNTLISVFRYMFLRDSFDQVFWDKLLEPMNHPMEAGGITTDFDNSYIYLI